MMGEMTSAQMTSAQMIALVPVRGGALPQGADETVAEAGGLALVVGDGAFDAAQALTAATAVTAAEAELDDTGALVGALAAVLGASRAVLLPASPDGRDLAPPLAAAMRRPLLAGATAVSAHGAVVSRAGGFVLEDLRSDGPFVATLVPGVRGVAVTTAPAATITELDLGVVPGEVDLRTVAVLPPDPATIDLAEAQVIVAGGNGLGSKERFDQLGAVGRAVGAALGGTRVASDAGWIPFERQIGTTGVTVAPRTYLAFAISGATQHVTGLGDPDHVVSVNLDPSCPMMAMADLAIVADANAVLDELAARLLPRRSGDVPPGPASGIDPAPATQERP